jgi:hypothetical protein
MKLIHSTGKELTVRDVGPVIFRLTAGPVPIKRNGWSIVEDDVARDVLRELLSLGIYSGGKAG